MVDVPTGLAQMENSAAQDVKESPRKSRGTIPNLGHLPDLNKLSDVIRNLVMGNVVFVRPILKPRKICIYTCADLKGKCTSTLLLSNSELPSHFT